MVSELQQMIFRRLYSLAESEDQIHPCYIGKFHGIEGLPTGPFFFYPAFYFWDDTQDHVVRFSINNTRLGRWCGYAVAEMGLDEADPEVAACIKVVQADLIQVVKAGFTAMMAKINEIDEENAR